MKPCLAVLCLCLCVLSTAAEETQAHDGKFVERLATQMTEVMMIGIKQGYGDQDDCMLLDADAVQVGVRVALSVSKKLEFFRDADTTKEGEQRAYRRTIADLTNDVHRNWAKRGSLSSEENAALYTMALYLRAAFPDLRDEMSSLLDQQAQVADEDEL